jgi:hypothetical protein
MIRSEVPDIVTVVACPMDDTSPATIHNNFIDKAVRTLTAKKAACNRLLRAASVHDMEKQISDLLPHDLQCGVKLQIVGHSLSGALLLGAGWLPSTGFWPAAHNFPFYALTPDPMVLGLLAPHAGKFKEVIVVGCNVGSDSSYGYAMNGRTLTYALAEVLRCQVLGADDLVSPDDFDAHGWYTPGAGKRRPQGWHWNEESHPEWVDGGLPVSPRRRAETVVSFEVLSVTATLLPVPSFAPLELHPTIHLACRQLDRDRLPSALPEISLETDQGPAHLLCSGRYLNIGDTYYSIERNPQLAAILSRHLWQHRSAAKHTAAKAPAAPQAAASATAKRA